MSPIDVDCKILKSQIALAVGPEKQAELESILEGLEQITSRVNINSVTGAPNGNQLQRDLRLIINNRDGVKKKIYVAMVDIDHFGLFNKKYGEQVGNEVLSAVNQSIKTSLRDDDLVLELSDQRYGYHLHGEEMLALYLCKNISDAYSVAERVRNNVSVESKELTGHKVAISLGITEYHPHIEEFKDAQHRADIYMQMAKLEGRDRTYCGETDPLYNIKKKIYFTENALENLVQKAADSVKQLKGKIGNAATKLYSNLIK